MFRLLGLAALAGAAWALLRRKSHRAGAGPPKTRTRIAIGGNPSAPRITCEPEQLDPKRGQEVIWDVENQTGTVQTISLEKFGHKHKPGNPPPLAKSDADRRVPVDKTATITDRVRGSAALGPYKYSIFLNGAEAVDPEIVIHDV